MSAPGAAAVEAAVRAEDASRVRALLAHATETDRRALAKELKPLLTGPELELPKPIMFTSTEDGMAFVFGQMAAASRGEEPAPPAAEREHSQWWELSQTAAFAALAVGVAGGRAAAERALDECHGRDYHISEAELAAIAGVLADRNPPWLAELAERRLTATESPGGDAWPLARCLVRLGAIERPAVPQYGAAIVQALTQDPPVSPPQKPGQPRFVPYGYDGPRRTMAGTGGDRLARALLCDPGLLEHEIWRLFTDPGTGREMEDRRWVTSWDQLVVGDQWADALVLLAAGGHLDRDRLLDECLDAFLRDFPPNHVGWYVSLHDRIGPSDDEVAARSSRYLALLAARGKPGVTLGQKMCARLLDAQFPAEGRLDPAAFLAASGPALLYPQKSVATAQLKLIGKLAAGLPGAAKDRAPRDSALHDSALATAAQAFAHQREDVQAAALKLLARHGLPRDPGARAAVADLASALPPVLAPEARQLGLLPDPAPPAPPAGSPPPALPAAAGTAEDGLAAGGGQAAPAARVTGVEETAELVSLLAQLIEDASDALAVERAVAGAVRLAGLPLAERAEAAGPLFKRARRQALHDAFPGPFSGHVIRADMSWLTLTWGTGELPPASTAELQGWHPAGHDVPWRSRRPTVLSGILSARIGEACTLIAAGRSPGLLAEPEFADGTISPAELAARQARWAAARRTPRQHDLEVARLRAAPGTGRELTFEPFITLPRVRTAATPYGPEQYTVGSTQVRARLAKVPPSAPAPRCWPLLTHLAHSRDDRRFAVHRSGVRLDEMIAAWPLLCPHDPELIAAHLLSPLSDGLGPGRNAAVTALRGLANQSEPFGRMCHLALVTGLSGAGAEVRIAAADAWTQLAGQGRLDPALASGAIEFGVTGGAFTLSRIAAGLRHAAAGPAAAPSVARACLTATAALLPARPAGLHLLLELAAQAGTASAMPELPAPVAALAQGRGTSKLTEAARRLTRLC